MGHSMGSLISLLAAHQDQDHLFQGLILLAVPYMTDLSMRIYAQAFKPLSFLTPNWDVPYARFDPSQETTDESWARRYKEDNLVCQGGLKTRMFIVFCKVGRTIQDMFFPKEGEFSLRTCSGLKRLSFPS